MQRYEDKFINQAGIEKKYSFFTPSCLHLFQPEINLQNTALELRQVVLFALMNKNEFFRDKSYKITVPTQPSINT